MEKIKHIKQMTAKCRFNFQLQTWVSFGIVLAKVFAKNLKS